jgi:hypothetical protein
VRCMRLKIKANSKGKGDAEGLRRRRCLDALRGAA